MIPVEFVGNVTEDFCKKIGGEYRVRRTPYSEVRSCVVVVGKEEREIPLENEPDVSVNVGGFGQITILDNKTNRFLFCRGYIDEQVFIRSDEKQIVRAMIDVGVLDVSRVKKILLREVRDNSIQVTLVI